MRAVPKAYLTSNPSATEDFSAYRFRLELVRSAIRVVPVGFGSLNHGIWPLIKVVGGSNVGLQTLRGTNLKSLMV